MTKTERKIKLQDKLMYHMMAAFYGDELTNEESTEMRKQVARVEKLFGYKPYSWSA